LNKKPKETFKSDDKISISVTSSSIWHLYVLAGLISIWPWDLAHRLSRATPYRDVIPGPLTATDMFIVYNVTHFEYSRNVNHHTRCVITCVWERIVGGVGEQRLRHRNGSVLSSLKMEGIRFFYDSELNRASIKCAIKNKGVALTMRIIFFGGGGAE
jgi:hypothetical protein